jgi:TonB family protein
MTQHITVQSVGLVPVSSPLVLIALDETSPDAATNPEIPPPVFASQTVDIPDPIIPTSDDAATHPGWFRGLPFTAPRPDPSFPVSPSEFAKKAGLRTGQSASIILTLEIGTDGRLKSVAMERSSGDAATDAAAVDYVRALHWIPGTKDGSPATVRLRFPVFLAVTPDVRMLPS